MKNTKIESCVRNSNGTTTTIFTGGRKVIIDDPKAREIRVYTKSKNSVMRELNSSLSKKATKRAYGHSVDFH